MLPEYPPMSSPTFTWGNFSDPEFATLLDTTYAEVVHWRHNCFSVPFGKVGRDFLSGLLRFYLAYGSASALEAVSLKAAIVLCILLLQKPSKRSKTKDHIKCFERRSASWSNGDLEELVREGRTIQHRLPINGSVRPKTNLARSFANLMFMGKCKAVLEFISNVEKRGILHLNDPAVSDDPTSSNVREVLINKHPPAQSAQSNCILDEEPHNPHPVIFESIDVSIICSAALRVTGAAGPSGLDGYEWRRLCTSHEDISRDLLPLATIARRICSSYVDPTSIKPLLACRLIALNKHPGVRPIVIGDTAHWIIAKAVLSIAARY